jgi:hypothetical protein
MPPVRRTAVVLSALLALAVGVSAALSATPAPKPPQQEFRALKRPAHSYDTLPKTATDLAGKATLVRRVATALDSGKRAYFIYLVMTKDKQLCTVLVQQNGYKADCAPVSLALEKGRRTTEVYNGLIGGAAANDVKKVVLAGGSRHLTVPLSSDNGYIYGCPAPSKCASWVKQVLGYSAAGKLISRQDVR